MSKMARHVAGMAHSQSSESADACTLLKTSSKCTASNQTECGSLYKTQADWRNSRAMCLTGVGVLAFGEAAAPRANTRLSLAAQTGMSSTGRPARSRRLSSSCVMLMRFGNEAEEKV
eukprot:CAMPEP_0115709384 /NCGR_PEP_ID=MMETSP0272-20121206/72441_1 /TAXON_ID=71861 /ORGANISM="Scrippsiella trochoidea, Strain CCMP3099" /LENGTH=116 /DNA_ID=CAMNT_0003150987 /DNA_START=29 /DNA_END=379 /DNA_ORIENTATION=-